MNNLNETSKIKSVVGVLLILMSLLVFVFLIRPFALDVDETTEQVEKRENDVSIRQDRLTFLNAENAALEIETDVSKSLVEKAIPNTMNQDDVIQNITDIAEENTVELNSISFGKGAKSEDGISILRVNASFEGGFGDLIRFLEGVESADREYVINSISVQLASLEVGGVRRANFSLSMETFYQLSQDN